MTTPRTIDGAAGGGQILRTSLALSMHTGEPFRIARIRASRPKTGLQRQHLASVQAAQAVCGAEVEGAELRSKELVFRPGDVHGGEHAFDVGTAGSTGLVLQTVLPVLVTAPEPSRIDLRGGTHNEWAPPFDFLARSFLPLLGRMGASCSATLHRHGFYPAGGGRVTYEVRPADRLARLDLLERGDVRDVRARVLISGIGRHVAERERDTLLRRTGWPEDVVRIERLPAAHGPGNALLVEIESDALTTVVTAFGRRDVRAEDVARLAADEARVFLDAVVPVDRHLADQLLLPMAIAGGGRFRTVAPVDAHTTSNAALIAEWLGLPIAIEDESPAVAAVTVG